MPRIYSNNKIQNEPNYENIWPTLPDLFAWPTKNVVEHLPNSKRQVDVLFRNTFVFFSASFLRFGCRYPNKIAINSPLEYRIPLSSARMACQTLFGSLLKALKILEMAIFWYFSLKDSTLAVNSENKFNSQKLPKI